MDHPTRRHHQLRYLVFHKFWDSYIGRHPCCLANSRLQSRVIIVRQHLVNRTNNGPSQVRKPPAKKSHFLNPISCFPQAMQRRRQQGWTLALFEYHVSIVIRVCSNIICHLSSRTLMTDCYYLYADIPYYCWFFCEVKRFQFLGRESCEGSQSFFLLFCFYCDIEVFFVQRLNLQFSFYTPSMFWGACFMMAILVSILCNTIHHYRSLLLC